MEGKLGVLGLVLTAGLVLSAMAARAEAHTFTSNSQNGNTAITGIDEPLTDSVFTLNGSTITCENTFFEGTAEANSFEELTIVPGFYPCDLGGYEAEVNVNDCAFVFDGETTEEHAVLAIECAEGNDIELDVPGLETTLTVTPQTGLSGVLYTNVNGAVTIKATVSGIQAECTGPTIVCFTLGGETLEIEYSGEIEILGYEDQGNAGTATTPSYEEGSTVEIAVD
ncbi:MAG: hypothetical protein R2725_03260 [Solirubrobacterales bacterium]